MPSITYWSRLEPRPRTASLAEGLAARIRDPAWLLCRQWQLGEFRGEDAASPAYVTVARHLGQVDAWRAGEGPPQPLAAAPLEAQVLAEDVDGEDMALAAELGATFERALADAGRGDLVAPFRIHYPIAPLAGDARARDPDAARFIDVLAGRRVHCVALLAAARISAPEPPAPTPADAASRDAVLAALAAATALVGATLLPDADRPAPSWRPERLDYAVDLVGRDPGGAPLTLAAGSTRDGMLEWHAFDVGTSGTAPPAEIRVDTRSLIPTLVTFRGMPSPRFWGFEHCAFNVAAVRPDKRELGKLLVLDFLLVHGVDWYSIPLRQPLGTVAAIESLVVHDVFGETTSIGPIPTGSGVDRWSLFTLSRSGADPAPWLFLAPTAGAAMQRSPAREEVRFSRDEMANLAWAIERTVWDPAGSPRSAHERAGRTAAPPPAGTSSLTYKIQTHVPDNWFPLLPVAIEPGSPETALERGVVVRDASAAPEPAGRILASSDPPVPLRIAEDALPRTGVIVSRVVHRVRWIDGTTSIWSSRRFRRASGEESSGLRFDVLVEGR